MADGIEFRPIVPPARSEQVKPVESRNHELDRRHRFLEELKKGAEEETEDSLPQEEEQEEEKQEHPSQDQNEEGEHHIDLTA